jgi:hypothetical protein
MTVVVLAGAASGLPAAASLDSAPHGHLVAFNYDSPAAFTTAPPTARSAGFRAYDAAAQPARAVIVASAHRLAAEGGATLYRAVGAHELQDIEKVGAYRVAAGGTEGKYFFNSPEQASNFARMMGDQPYTTTSVRVPAGQLAHGHPINPAGEGPGYFFPTPHVPSGPVTIFNHSVLP